ncbi:hypothetical protein DUK53_10510 [Listeria sp. SHR_NRA_18]|nr:hypothetical protein DUK53_10510 [Listeria sp. SHR_NRA_18]
MARSEASRRIRQAGEHEKTQNLDSTREQDRRKQKTLTTCKQKRLTNQSPNMARSEASRRDRQVHET